MTETPEGYLIARNVPIARTGSQDYLRRELGLTDDPEGVIQVYRSPEQVFDPAAIASFEGKSVTDEHPPENLRPDNYANYERGHIEGVHRGAGDDADHLLADLVIKDPTLISAVQHGKREVSCGYDCDYEPQGDGTYRQTHIRGNHVAVVAAGRAGPQVAIRDALPQASPGSERRRYVKPNRQTLFGKMLSAFAKDAEPEELAEAARMMHEHDAEEPEEPKPSPEPPKPADADPEDDNLDRQILAAIQQVAAEVKSLGERVAQLEQPEETPEEDALTTLERELGKGEPAPGGEESVTIEPEKITGDSPDDDPGPVMAPEQRAENPIPGADRAAIQRTIRIMRPIIAALPKDQQKPANDALAKALRDDLAARGKGAHNGYAGILAAQRDNAAALDAKPGAVNDEALGEKIMAERNLQRLKKGGK